MRLGLGPILLLSRGGLFDRRSVGLRGRSHSWLGHLERISAGQGLQGRFFPDMLLEQAFYFTVLAASHRRFVLHNFSGGDISRLKLLLKL